MRGLDTPLSGDTLLSASDAYFFPADLSAQDVLPTPIQRLAAEQAHFSRALSEKLREASGRHGHGARSVSPPPLPSTPPQTPPGYAYEPANPYRDVARAVLLPPSYTTPLPHFHPPRFSRRLRRIVAQRARPLTVDLSRKEKQTETQTQTETEMEMEMEMEMEKGAYVALDSALTVQSAPWPPTPKSGFEAWVEQSDPRVLMCLSVLGVLALLSGGAWLLARVWAAEGI